MTLHDMMLVLCRRRLAGVFHRRANSGAATRPLAGGSIQCAVTQNESFSWLCGEANQMGLFKAGVAPKLLRRIGRRAWPEGALSSERFKVDATLIEAWWQERARVGETARTIRRLRGPTRTSISTRSGAPTTRTLPRTSRRRCFFT